MRHIATLHAPWVVSSYQPLSGPSGGGDYDSQFFYIYWVPSWDSWTHKFPQYQGPVTRPHDRAAGAVMALNFLLKR